MKNLFLVAIFIIFVVVGIVTIPILLRHFLGIDQPIMTVVSNSMWPKLSRGDIIFVVQAQEDDIEIGSVVVFRHEGGLAVHRVVEMTDWSITTKGDANVKEDEPIYYSNVVGRVPSIGSWLIKIPWIGHIALLANPQAGTVEPGEESEVDFFNQLLRLILSPAGFIIIIILPLVLLFQDVVLDAIAGILPMSTRKRRLRVKSKHLQAKWGAERTKRALRI